MPEALPAAAAVPPPPGAVAPPAVVEPRAAAGIDVERRRPPWGKQPRPSKAFFSPGPLVDDRRRVARNSGITAMLKRCRSFGAVGACAAAPSVVGEVPAIAPAVASPAPSAPEKRRSFPNAGGGFDLEEGSVPDDRRFFHTETDKKDFLAGVPALADRRLSFKTELSLPASRRALAALPAADDRRFFNIETDGKDFFTGAPALADRRLSLGTELSLPASLAAAVPSASPIPDDRRLDLRAAASALFDRRFALGIDEVPRTLLIALDTDDRRLFLLDALRWCDRRTAASALFDRRFDLGVDEVVEVPRTSLIALDTDDRRLFSLDALRWCDRRTAASALFDQRFPVE